MEESTGRSSSVSQGELVYQLQALGVEEDGVLIVHTSYRAVRPVEGGPAGLIDALRVVVGIGGTIVMPSWGSDDDRAFDPATTPAAADLGATAEIFRHLPGIHRSNHPFAFAALGPQAEAITADPLPLPPHGPASPVGRVHELDGQILLLGVGHDANTMIHLAEVLAGVPYGVSKHCTVMQGGRPARIDYTENDHCTRRFALVDGWMRSRELQWDSHVGHADARLMSSRDVVTVVRERLARDPLVFLHERGSGCAECKEARDSVPESVSGARELRRDAISDDQRTIRLLLEDIAATIGGDHEATVRELALLAGQFVDGDDLTERIVEKVQQYFHDTFVDTTWPACPRHPNHPLWFTRDAWRCEHDDVEIAALGTLRGNLRHR